jgi:deoxycytidylate deaminase
MRSGKTTSASLQLKNSLSNTTSGKKMATKNSGIVNIHGREYFTVGKRVQMFREVHGLELSLITEIVSRDQDCVVMKATILDAQGRILATGHSEEYREASQINSTSCLENSETSAIGRALAALGMGGSEFASADEVANAISQQRKGHSASDGAFEALENQAEKETAKAIASDMVDLWEQGKEHAAYECFYEANLSNEMKLAVWELLRPNSKVRNGVKKISEANKVKEAA